MRLLTVLRGLAWLGVAVAGWSVNLKWGDDPALGTGAPTMWERHVVGATLLAAVAALALSISGRGGRPPRLPYRLAALAASALALGLALSIYLRVTRSEFYEHMVGIVSGPGFAWLAAGTAMSFAAAVGAVGLREPAAARRSASKRRKKRGR
jgi:hypothetical protein